MEAGNCGFGTLIAHRERRPRRVRGFLLASLAVHLALLGIVSTLHAPSARPLPGPAVKVTFVDRASLPHPTVSDPPPPPPPKRRSVRKTAEVKPQIKPREVPREVLPADKLPPLKSPDDQADQSDDGVDDGTKGGVAGGVVGGVVGGLVGSKTPPPRLAPAPAPPPAPTFQDVAFVRKRRIEGNDPAYPPRAERNGIEGVVVAKVVISPQGQVTEVVLVQSHPAFEQAVRDAIAGWKFAPHVVAGKAVAVYTVFRFTFKLS